MARSFAERLRAHEQQKAKLAEQEAKLKDAERKARTRRLIEAGGLVEKACLLDLDPNALYAVVAGFLQIAVNDPFEIPLPFGWILKEGCERKVT